MYPLDITYLSRSTIINRLLSTIIHHPSKTYDLRIYFRSEIASGSIFVSAKFARSTHPEQFPSIQLPISKQIMNQHKRYTGPWVGFPEVPSASDWFVLRSCQNLYVSHSIISKLSWTAHQSALHTRSVWYAVCMSTDWQAAKVWLIQ